jgi:hypothetical protein
MVFTIVFTDVIPSGFMLFLLASKPKGKKGEASSSFGVR